MRLVSLTPSLTEIVERLGGRGKLAGITKDCLEEESPLAIGFPKALDLPKIEGLSPDLILVDANENRPDEIRMLQKKWRVVSFDTRSVGAVVDTVWGIGRLLDEMPRAEALKKEIESAEAECRAAKESRPPVRALILLWNQPYLTVNFDTYASRLVETCGGVNVFREEPLRELPLDLEDMIEKNPQILLLASEPFPFKKRHIAGFRKYRVFSGCRIELIDGRLFSRFGPRTVDALKTLRNLLR